VPAPGPEEQLGLDAQGLGEHTQRTRRAGGGDDPADQQGGPVELLQPDPGQRRVTEVLGADQRIGRDQLGVAVGQQGAGLVAVAGQGEAAGQRDGGDQPGRSADPGGQLVAAADHGLQALDVADHEVRDAGVGVHQRGAGRVDLFGGLRAADQQGQHAVRALPPHPDVRVHMLDQGPPGRVGGQGEGVVEQREDLVVAAGELPAAGRADQHPGPFRAAAEPGGLPERARRRRVARAPAGPQRGLLQLQGDVVVGGQGGRGQVPGPGVGRGVAGHAGQGLGQRRVRGDAVVHGGAVVGHRPQQRVPELDPPVVDGDQVVLLRRREVTQVQPGRPGRLEQRADVAADRGRGQHQRPAGAVLQLVQPAAQGTLDPRARGHERRGDTLAVQLGPFPAQLDDAERVAGRRGVHPLARAGRGDRQRLAAQLVDVLDGQSGQRDLLRAQAVGVGRVAGRQQQRDAVGVQPAPGEEHGLPRGGVQPLQIVDDDQQGRDLGRRGQDPDGGGAHGETVTGDRRTDGQRAAQRLRLRAGQVVQDGQDRAEQIGQAGERDLRLVLVTAGGQHPHAGGLLDRVADQGGLADARLAGEHQCRAAPAARTCQKAVDQCTFGGPSEHHRPSVFPLQPDEDTRTGSAGADSVDL
jgi:hypothetical protein